MNNMRLSVAGGAAIILFLAGCQTSDPTLVSRPKVKLGVEVLLDERLDLLRGKHVGLITNPSGIDSQCRSIVDLFARRPEFKLTALFGPEHGVRGDAQAGQHVPFYFDDKYHLPVFSLYGQTHKPPPAMLTNMDEYMRSFDTSHTDKTPPPGTLQGVDVMVFDMQDVGVRVYTYIATMASAMQACAESGIPFIVLDRPNPINGVALEGPILEYPEYSSFVGLYATPIRHGLTIGELALLFNDRFQKKKAPLTVVPMKGWRRYQWYDDTHLPWVMPSPNMPTLETATVYAGQVYFEGTNLSEGRGTTRPFEIFGAAWIDGFELARTLNALKLPGVAFRETWFTPTFSKFKDERCGGCQVQVLDRNAYQPLTTTLHIIQTVRAMYPDKFQFHTNYFDKIMGTAKVRQALEKGTPVAQIVATFQPGLAEFRTLRKPYLLY
jgi:uncharacterized protein YbbC (DUF1343 family)